MRARAYIWGDYASERAGVYQSNLRKLYRSDTGSSFVDYLADYRITVAKRMMARGERRAGISGEQSGFSSTQ